MTKRILAIVLGLAMAFSAGSVWAGITSGTANYEVTLLSGCAINAVPGYNFGSYALGSGDLSGQWAGQLEVNCAAGVNYMWGINSGTYGAAGTTFMFSGTDAVTYVLSESSLPIGDSGLTAIDGGYTETNPNPGRSNTGTGAIQTYIMRADVLINAATTPGVYSDRVTVSVVWP